MPSQAALRALLTDPLAPWGVGAFFAADLINNRCKLGGRYVGRLENAPGISITRATTGYALTQQGQLVQFPSGAARITDRGLLVEGAATNLFLNSTAPVTQDINFASTGQRTLSVWGSGSVAVAQNSATITGAGTATQGSPVTFNVTATGTCTFTVTGTPTFVQVEATAYATSPIVTAGASATRNADVISVGSVTGLTYANGVTLFAEFERASDTGTNEGVFAVSNNTTNEEAYLYVTPSDTLAGRIRSGAADQMNNGVTGALAVGTIYRSAMRVATNDGIAARGGTLSAQDTSVTVPAVAPTTIRFGARGDAGVAGYLYLRRLAIFPSAYTDAQLQAITT